MPGRGFSICFPEAVAHRRRYSEVQRFISVHAHLWQTAFHCSALADDFLRSVHPEAHHHLAPSPSCYFGTTRHNAITRRTKAVSAVHHEHEPAGRQSLGCHMPSGGKPPGGEVRVDISCTQRHRPAYEESKITRSRRYTCLAMRLRRCILTCQRFPRPRTGR